MQIPDDEEYKPLRQAMVEKQIIDRGIEDVKLIHALLSVPRHLFVPENLRSEAYRDKALPLGPGQSISQPYICAFMLKHLRLSGTERVLEVGSGSGYVAALLSYLAKEVHAIELDPELVDTSRRTLESLGVDNISLRCADGFQGWPDYAPFDAILVSAAPDHVPRELVSELVDPGGRIVLPVSSSEEVQELVLLEKTPEGLRSEELGAVRFVALQEGEG